MLRFILPKRPPPTFLVPFSHQRTTMSLSFTYFERDFQLSGLSFRTDVTTHWNSFVGVDLVANQTKILGPMSCFLRGRQVLGWQVHPNLVVVTLKGRNLHLLLSPLEEWHDLLAQDWIAYAWSKRKWKPDWAPLHVSIHDWRAARGVGLSRVSSGSLACYQGLLAPVSIILTNLSASFAEQRKPVSDT